MKQTMKEGFIEYCVDSLGWLEEEARNFWEDYNGELTHLDGQEYKDFMRYANVN